MTQDQLYQQAIQEMQNDAYVKYKNAVRNKIDQIMQAAASTDPAVQATLPQLKTDFQAISLVTIPADPTTIVPTPVKG